MCVSQKVPLSLLQQGWFLYSRCVSLKVSLSLLLQGWFSYPMYVSQKVPLSLLLQVWSLYPICVSQKVPLSLVITGVVSIPHVCLAESTIVSGHYRGGLYTPCVSHRKYHYLCYYRGGLYTPCVSHRSSSTADTTEVVFILHGVSCRRYHYR